MSTVSQQGYSSIGYKPRYTRKCKFCEEVDIVLNYEPVYSFGKTRFRWVCRNAHTGSIHSCRSKTMAITK